MTNRTNYPLFLALRLRSISPTRSLKRSHPQFKHLRIYGIFRRRYSASILKRHQHILTMEYTLLDFRLIMPLIASFRLATFPGSSTTITRVMMKWSTRFLMGNSSLFIRTFLETTVFTLSRPRLPFSTTSGLTPHLKAVLQNSSGSKWAAKLQLTSRAQEQ